jgi:TRAP-type C4-dicarboxylate transport system substrate-binding protein
MGGGWAQEIEYLSGGRVKFDYLVGAVEAGDMYDQLVAGTGDVAQNVILLWTGRFPTLEIMTVPKLFSECQRPSKVAWDMWQKFPAIQQEFSDTKVIAIYASTPSPPGIGFATKDKPIDTLEKCKGVKMGQYGLWSTKRTNALGFTAVAVPNPEVYESIQRGVVDGSFMDFDFLTNQNVGELVNYWHPIGMLYCPFFLGMNWDSWNKLSPDIQKMMEEVAPNVPDWADYYLRQDKIRIAKDWPDLITVTYTDEEKAKWIAATEPVAQEYIAELNKKGVDGQAVYDEMNRLFGVYKDALEINQLPEKQGGSL